MAIGLCMYAEGSLSPATYKSSRIVHMSSYNEVTLGVKGRWWCPADRQDFCRAVLFKVRNPPCARCEAISRDETNECRNKARLSSASGRSKGRRQVRPPGQARVLIGSEHLEGDNWQARSPGTLCDAIRWTTRARFTCGRAIWAAFNHPGPRPLRSPANRAASGSTRLRPRM